MAQTNYSLKDQLFNRATVTELSRSIEKVYPPFDGTNYIEECLNGFDSRELKERMTYMRECLESYLPDSYMEATEIMLRACDVTEAVGAFPYGAFCEYVEMNGCNEDYLNHSLRMLGEYTKVLSAEFAIRKFINEFPEETFAAMMGWAKSDDTDQRRLASEGLRSKLPWAKGINFDPIRATEPLNSLYDDTERYVTRSVANHMNDLSKIKPEAVIDLLEKWRTSDKQDTKEMTYIISHSTRTLVKKGHPGALDLLGYPENPQIDISGFRVLTPEINMGDALVFECTILAKEDSKLMIDYVIDYPMANKKRSSKVFKIKKCAIEEGKPIQIQKKHMFRVMTTKKLYTGTYNVQLQINGKRYVGGSFFLKV